MIELSGFSKKYSDKSDFVVKDINLKAEKGTVTGLLGLNGAGKTTTIKMVTGILSSDEGDIFLNGISLHDNPLKAKTQFAFVPDNPETFSRLKAIEYLNFIADVYKVPSDVRKQRIEELCERFGLNDVLLNKISSFSHGMKQKLFLIAKNK